MITHPAQLTLTNKLSTNRVTAPFWDRNAEQEGGTTAPIAGHASKVLVDEFTFWTRRSQPIVVRPVLPDDCAPISAMLRSLSARSIERRYLIPQPMTAVRADQEAHRMVHGQRHDHLTLIASTPGAHGSAIIAVAELVRDGQQPTLGEFALVVRDDLQGAGIGTVLLRCLARIALAAGILTLCAYVLPENQAMLAVVRNLGLPYTTAYQDGELEIWVQLARFGATTPQGKLTATRQTTHATDIRSFI